MSESPLRLIKRSAEYLVQSDVLLIPKGLRGIYVLYKATRGRRNFNVVYVGMTNSGGGGLRSRLIRHRQNKGDLWTHASLYEVWDNIRDEEVRELEGLFRHIYRHDSRANSLNIQRGFKKLRQLRDDYVEDWQ